MTEPRWTYKRFSIGSKTKTCPECRKRKPLAEFGIHRRAKSGRQTYCRKCTGLRQRIFRAENLEQYRAKEKRSHHRNRDSQIWRQFERRSVKHGTPVVPRLEFRKWYAEQKKTCVFCGMNEEKAVAVFGRRLNIDRKVTAEGYVLWNMCLACQRCNLVKNGYLTYEQMMIVADMFFKERGYE